MMIFRGDHQEIMMIFKEDLHEMMIFREDHHEIIMIFRGDHQEEAQETTIGITSEDHQEMTIGTILEDHQEEETEEEIVGTQKEETKKEEVLQDDSLENLRMKMLEMMVEIGEERLEPKKGEIQNHLLLLLTKLNRKNKN